MVRICVTWDVLLVLLVPPQDFTFCRAGARPGHPITGHASSPADEHPEESIAAGLLGPNARVASLERYEKHNRKAEPQAAFLKVESRATRPDSCPLPVTDHSVSHRGRRTISHDTPSSKFRGFAVQSQTWMRGLYQMPR